MALSTLAAVKQHLGIVDTTEDAPLTAWLAAASLAIRDHCGPRYLYGMLGAIALGSPAAITCPGHGLETGDVISIVGSGSTPSLDGLQTVTVVDPFTFTVPVHVTAISGNANAAGVFARQYTEYYSGNGTKYLRLAQVPVQSIVNVWFDLGGYYGDPSTAFASTTLLTEGTDFALVRDNNSASDCSHSGLLVRIDGYIWPRPTVRTQGLLALSRDTGDGNLKVQYVAGYTRTLSQVQLACHEFVGQLRRSAATGANGPLTQEKYDYYSYQRDPQTEAQCLDSVKSLLKRHKEWTW
ncbi:MAG TPA: head-tail connector protein [Planctomycetaceae bacterium]|nr:head-tail connector protein [Planctomycetaceae bacterium]